MDFANACRHYLGNNGTTNYRLKLSWPHVIGAATIAVVACLVSFGLFFHWAGHWMNNIWRRVVVACFLALAVSGLHWTAAAGTWYEIRGYHDGPGQQRNTNLIIALCLVSHANLYARLGLISAVPLCLRCVLPTWFPETASTKTGERPRTTCGSRSRNFRPGWQASRESGRSDALPNNHSAVSSKSTLC